jgi:SAM-dependent methyltransferase
VTRDYTGYFRKHYRFAYSASSLRHQQKFFASQLRLLRREFELDAWRSRPVLEVGSGIGVAAKSLLEIGFDNYKGIELDGEAVAFTTENVGPYFEHVSLAQLAERSSDRFDLVCAFEVLEHLDEPLVELGRIASLLEPGGRFVATTPYPFRRAIDSDETHLHVLHPKNWERLCVRSGFRSVTTRPMSFIPALWNVDARLNPVLPFYVPVLKVVSTTLIIADR